jgi:hypothetical protein
LKVSNNQKSHPVARIVAWALCVGFVSFAAGWFGPIYLAPSSNLASLLGFLVTGPLGTLAGALIGALGVAKDSRRIAIACIGLVWVMTLLYTFGIFALGGWGGIPALPLQLLVLASIVYLFFYRPDTPAQPPDVRQRCAAIAAAAVATILLMTLFPPVIRPSWTPAAQLPATTDTPLPSFAFIFDRGFHVSPGYALFDVNRAEIAAEWIITVAAAIGLCLLMRALRPRPAA